MRNALVKLSLIGLAVVVPTAAAGMLWLSSNSTGLAPESMRGELAEGIVDAWSSEAERRYKMKPGSWANAIKPTLDYADIANLERAASAATFEQMGSALAGRSTSMHLKSGLSAHALAPLGTELVFTPITPCRIADTRLVGGPIAGGMSRGFEAYTSTDFTGQGGDATNCGIPADVAAVSINLAATNVPRLGNFIVYASDVARPNASALNYQAGGDSSNEVNVKLCRTGCPTQFTIYNNNTAGVNAVVDVTGYYSEAAAAELDCTVAQQTGNLDLLGGLQTRSVSCPAGYTATGGGCGGPLGIGVSNSQPLVTAGTPSGWSCDLVGSLLSVISYQVSATCCRTPGR
jgi:hypothetical protein